ncbi:hypothetical protein ACF3NX_07100 [Acetobacter orientalis]|uniref:hypothetical protein n=1 Tax=Acetobacter orientalis TaxID=146474 RepID=UPI003863F38D
MKKQSENITAWDKTESNAELKLPAFFHFSPVRKYIMFWLIIALPFFGEIFHYLNSVKPLWAFSKLMPVLSLPLIFHLRGYSLFPISRQVIFTFTWLLLSPTIASIFYFHEGFFTAITAQVKILPILYFFSFLSFLLILKPKLYEIEKSFIILGLTTTIILLCFWLTIPNSWYQEHYVVGSAPFFSSDNRGHRIRMQMYFAIIALFFFYRRGFAEKRVIYFLSAAAIFFVTLLLVKTRAMIIGCTGVLLPNTIVWVPPFVRIVVAGVAPFALVGMFSTGYLASTFSTSASSGIDVRRSTAQLAIHFLGEHPFKWIFGVGTLSPTSTDTLMKYFHHFFFLADITWLGIVFEYGLFGASLIIAFQLRGLIFFKTINKIVSDDFLGALRDYLLYVLIISIFYPPTLTPGETAVILSIFAYVWYAGSLDKLSFSTE